MYMNPPTSTGWMLAFDDKGNSRILEEGLPLKSDHRRDGDYNGNCHCGTGKVKAVESVMPQRPCFSLMQNCDLPPPVKLFNGTHKIVVASKKPPPCTFGGSKKSAEVDNEKLPENRGGFEDEKLSLLKALQLSQTRAREAERKAVLIIHERNRLSDFLLNESLQLLAHRQWVKLLELEVLQLQSERQREQLLCRRCCPSRSERQTESSEEEERENGDVGNLRLYVALALCLGIAGVGFAFGCGYLF